MQPVQRMHNVEQCHCFTHFVCLQRSNQMQFNFGVARPEFRPFGFRFLDPVLAEYPVPRIKYRNNALRGMSFADGYQPDFGGRCDGRPPRGLNSCIYGLEVFRGPKRNSCGFGVL